MSADDTNHRLAPASASGGPDPLAGLDTMEGLRAALLGAQEAANSAKQAAEAAQKAAASAQDAAERAARVLALATSLLGDTSVGNSLTTSGALPSRGASFGRDTRVLPRRIILVRHGESQVRTRRRTRVPGRSPNTLWLTLRRARAVRQGNLDENMYCRVPDPEISLTEKGHQQAADVGERIRRLIEQEQAPGSYGLFVYTSPYRRTKQTCADIVAQFPRECVLGVREEPQLREQDFGNFQDAVSKQREKAERNAYGRFFYRFPHGESGSDVYDRLTLFEDHLVRDIDAGRFPESANVVIVTHGLALRIFLARWLHWTVAEYESVYNPPNCVPVVLERTAVHGGDEEECSVDGSASACDPSGRHHTKNLYTLTADSMALLGAERTMELQAMLVPERAWERTLSGVFDDSTAECEIPGANTA